MKLILYKKRFFLTALLLFSGIGVFSQPETSPVKFFSSSDKKEIVIENMSEWEKQRLKILRGMEDAMGKLPEWPVLRETDMQITEESAEKHYTRYTITIKAYEKERVPAYLYIPHKKVKDDKFPAIIALHPTGALGKKIVDGEGLANRGYAKELAERGYVVIAPDYPSFGDLENFNFEADRYESGTMAAIFYHMRCIDYLNERDDVDPDRIGVIGHSLGGHNAMFLAAFDNRIKVIVSSCGWTQFEYYDIGKSAIERYGGRLGPWAQDRYMPLIRDKYNLDGEKIPFNFHEIIALFAPRAFFSNSPLNDSNFDVRGVVKGIAEAQKIYNFFGVPDQLRVRYPEAEHDFPPEVRMEAYRFIDEVLKHWIPSVETDGKG
ncbi:MAG: alpha/beta fold hydrolase [Bacteroidales bacterium]|nr:alpha/beta fold hydrolase [Bacteroidales bacterium]